MVIYEAFEDESVIIHFTSGNYFSIDTTGNEIWKLIVSGASSRETTDLLAQKYNAEAGNIEAAVNRFIEELQQENLIVPDVSDSTRTFPGTVDSEISSVKQAFTPPVLNKYSDMQGLLVLDPIHEVDDTGWPNAKPDSSK
jgi:hypothetical protein